MHLLYHYLSLYISDYQATMKLTRAKTTSVPGGSMNFIHTIDIEQ